MFKVTVSIDGFDEEGNANPDVQEEVIRKVAEMLSHRLEPKVMAIVKDVFKSTAEARISESVSDLLARPLQITNKYGEKKGDPVTFTEYIAQTGCEYLTAPVNDRGNTPSYNDQQMPRVAWMARDMAEKELAKELRPILDKAKSEAKEFITAKVASVIKQAMSEAIK